MPVLFCACPRTARNGRHIEEACLWFLSVISRPDTSDQVHFSHSLGSVDQVLQSKPSCFTLLRILLSPFISGDLSTFKIYRYFQDDKARSRALILLPLYVRSLEYAVKQAGSNLLSS